MDELTGDFTTIDHYIRETWAQIYQNVEVSSAMMNEESIGAIKKDVQSQLLEKQMAAFHENRKKNSRILMHSLRFLNRNGQPLHMMPKLKLDPALLEQPLYH